MLRTRRRDTGCEMALRRLLHAMGLRYRVDHPLPIDRRRRADLVFTGARVAVFVDGCFWHGCPLHGTTPRANRDWWMAKIDANRARDQDTIQRLRGIDWVGLRVWEHEDPGETARSVANVVRQRLEVR